MKKKFSIISICALVILLSSCSIHSFNRQKFTDLRSIKREKTENTSLKEITNSKLDGIDPIAEKVKKAIEDSTALILLFEDKVYQIQNPEYNAIYQSIIGDLVPIEASEIVFLDRVELTASYVEQIKDKSEVRLKNIDLVEEFDGISKPSDQYDPIVKDDPVDKDTSSSEVVIRNPALFNLKVKYRSYKNAINHTIEQKIPLYVRVGDRCYRLSDPSYDKYSDKIEGDLQKVSCQRVDTKAYTYLKIDSYDIIEGTKVQVSESSILEFLMNEAHPLYTKDGLIHTGKTHDTVEEPVTDKVTYKKSSGRVFGGVLLSILGLLLGLIGLASLVFGSILGGVVGILGVLLLILGIRIVRKGQGKPVKAM